MTSESAREQESKARLGYYAEWQKYYHQSAEDDQTVVDRYRAWCKSALQWDKAIKNRAMVEGKDLS
jgi:uncharacterized protein (DUF608 family)